MEHRTMTVAWRIALAACALGACDRTTELVDGGGAMDAAVDAGVHGDAEVREDGGARQDAAGDAGSVDGSAPPPECPAYRARCGGRCIPVTDDPANCGACGAACADGEVCFAGACAGSCPTGLVACGGRCADPRTDSAHCSDCDRACDAGMGCVGGNCLPAIAVDPSGVACEDGGPPITLPGVPEGPRACSGELAETTFLWALCSCEGIGLFNPLVTDAYDSTERPYGPGGAGGGVGTNGGFLTTSTGEIGGSLWAASPRAGVSTSNRMHVAHELRSGGELNVGNPFTIDRDAFVVGDVVSSSDLVVAGALHQSPGATITGTVTYGSLATEPVVVGDPCDCDARDRVPVVAIVEAARTVNDNAAIGLDPDALLAPGGPRRLDLPCGRYLLRGIDTNSPLTIATRGRTALFVDGDVDSSSIVDFVVEPGGELDVFVSGEIVVSGQLRVGSPTRPAATRLYIGGVGTALELTNDTTVGGFVYVAAGSVLVSNPIEVYGGIFAGAFRNSGSTTIHYDRGVLRAGDPCEPPPPDLTCDDCTDCGNQACIDGACASCTSSDQCCAPLVCVEGECILFE